MLKRFRYLVAVLLAGACTGLVSDPAGVFADPDVRDKVTDASVALPNPDPPSPPGPGGEDAGETRSDPADASLPPDDGGSLGLDSRPVNTSCIAPPRPVENTGVTAQTVFNNLTFNEPLGLLQAPGDNSRFFVLERRGRVRVFANNNNVSTAGDFINLTTSINSQSQEAGLLGMAFHPSFATNREVFLSYTDSSSPTGLRSVIARYRSTDNGQTLNPSTREILLTVNQPYSNHNGGHIAFGPDGYLYIGFGDGGSGGDPQGNAQNLNTVLGKMLRIDVNETNGTTPYAIPPTNPFRSGGGRPEIYAWGLRNPWRWSFDRATGELWLGDVGQGALEEVDKIQLGGNYGWNRKEGTRCYNASSCSNAGVIDPIVQYGRGDGISITGGFVYRGSAIPSLVGRFVYGDYGSGRIWAVTYNDVTGQAAPQQLMDTNFAIASFGEDQAGELYLTDFSGGKIRKLVPQGTPPPNNFPQKLSQTGCFDPSDPRKPLPALVPYDINAPLWSDGAAKERYLAIPDGTTIRINADGDWDFPNGSVLVKTFWLSGKRVETRLFMRHSDGNWGGYSYEWNSAQTDATLLPAGKSVQVGAQEWKFPSRAECLACHTAAAGRSLGLETAQLNRETTYPVTGRTRHQLETLSGLGFLQTAITTPAGQLPRFAPTDGADPVDAKARAYLHSNCSHCHRPQGPGQGPSDLRHSVSLAQMGICNVNPQNGTLGVTNARVLAPGAPERSLLSVRMHALDANRMPKIGSSVVDPLGTKVVDDWIRSMTGCP